MTAMTERERLRERERILALFEAHRETPGAKYDESRFLDFLLAEPARNRAVYESRAGLRRFNDFVDQLQLEYSIHLSQKDRDAHYPAEAFVARVLELRETPRASLASFQQHARVEVNWIAIAITNALVLLPALFLWQHPKWLAWLALPLLALNGFWYWYTRRVTRYNQRLYQQLVAAAGPKKPTSPLKLW
jgi:hypothetical protein